ncbi:MAG TPA: hypothetical protein VKW09_13075 [bacterium]|nr:hypothetical protein [bacterium]
MKSAKDAGGKSPPNDKPAQTPFERLTEFTRRLLTVPKTEIDKQRRDNERKGRRRH